MKMSTTVLLFILALLVNGCTYVQHSTNIVISPRINVQNAAIDRIGIAPFSFNRPLKEQLGYSTILRPGNAGEIVSDAIADIPILLGYDVVDRRQLKILLDENNLTISDLLNPETTAKLGKTLGMQGVIVGGVIELCDWSAGLSWGRQISFNLRLIRLDTGEVLWTATASKAGQKDMNVYLHELSKEIAENLKKQNAIRKTK